jgi:uncharacterized protein YyaL (SSP411 family)
VGKPDDPRISELLAIINSIYLPDITLQLVTPDQPLDKVSPVLAGKTQINDTATAYVCHNYTCSAPVTQPEEFKSLLLNQ